jgi:small subunit ribosomal protein S17
MTETTNTSASATAGTTAATAPAGAPVAQAPGDALGSGAGTQGARGYRKQRRGYVVSDKMDKTVVVEVEDRVKHPLYGKVLRRSSKVKAHDEGNVAGVGDLVLISETRPLSATKRWRVLEILERAK